MRTTMKLVLLMGLNGSLLVSNVFAQASFFLSNYWTYNGVAYFFPVYDWLGNPLEGSDWRAELYGGPTPDSMSPALDGDTGDRLLATFPKSGWFWRPSRQTVTVAQTGAAGWAWLQVKVWDIRLGDSFEQAAAKGCGAYGQSELFYARGAVWGGLELPQPLFGLTSFSVLEPVPDPPVTGLLVVGAAALAWRRRIRRKY